MAPRGPPARGPEEADGIRARAQPPGHGRGAQAPRRAWQPVRQVQRGRAGGVDGDRGRAHDLQRRLSPGTTPGGPGELVRRRGRQLRAQPLGVEPHGQAGRAARDHPVLGDLGGGARAADARHQARLPLGGMAAPDRRAARALGGLRLAGGQLRHVPAPLRDPPPRAVRRPHRGTPPAAPAPRARGRRELTTRRRASRARAPRARASRAGARATRCQ